MPFPLAHPVAVLPFRRWCPRPLSLVALVIGSVTPDAGYTLRHLDFDHFTHSALGSVLFCLPVGWISTLVVFALREPLASVLPSPHRQALLPLCTHPRPAWWQLALSVFLGTWTHIVFDRLTHESAARGFGADSFHEISSTVHGKWFYQVMWILVSTVCLVVIGVVYLRFLRRATGSYRPFDWGDRRRLFQWLALIILPYLACALLSCGIFTRRGAVFNKHTFYITLQPYLLFLIASLVVIAFVVRRRRALNPPAAKSSSDTPAPPG